MTENRKRAFRTWEVKNSGGKKTYGTALGSTDFDIPMFGYKSALLILTVIFGILLSVPWICFGMGTDYRPVTVILGGLGAGFSASYAQFFLESERGLCGRFWAVGSLLSVFAGTVILMLVYTGWLL